MEQQPQQQQQQQLGNAAQTLAGPGAFSSVRLAFVVDTSVSMCQRTPNGMTLLDVAKMAADRLVSSLFRQGGSGGYPQVDRCVLFNGQGELVASLGDPFSLFTESLQHLSARGKSDLGRMVTETMDAINAQRSGSNGDTFMRGRCPWKAVPWTVIVITDCSACRDFSPSPTKLLPDAEFADGLFRWDQRLYALVLGIPCVLSGGGSGSSLGSSGSGNGSGSGSLSELASFSEGGPECAEFSSYCADTGGACVFLRSVAQLNAAVDVLAGGMRAGVSIHVSCPKEGTDFKTQVFSPTNPILFWPFPEDTWVDYSVFTSPSTSTATVPPPPPSSAATGLGKIPKRAPHPHVVLLPGGECPRIPEKFPADRYELENAALAGALRPGLCYMACIAGGKESPQGSFGFLARSETRKGAVVLTVLMPGFQRLLALVDESQEKNGEWRRRIGEYVRELPLYYHEYLAKAFKYLGVFNILPDRNDRLTRPDKVDSQVIARRAKTAERLHFNPASVVNLNGTSLAALAAQKRQPLGALLGGLQSDSELIGSLGLSGGKLRIALTPRAELVQEMTQLRNRLFYLRNDETAADEEEKHQVPISRMGNFEERMKKKKELRTVSFSEESPYRKQLFGNPFKRIKYVDEADVKIIIIIIIIAYSYIC